MAKTELPVKDQTPVQIPRPDLQVVERGLRNVFGLPATEVQLRDPSFVTHWVNTGIGGDQLSKYLDAGYLKVRPEYLADPDRLSFTVSPEGYVVRGNRGEELLMYTLKENFRNRQMEKARRNAHGMRSDKTAAEVVEAASQQLGDQAADYLNRTGRPVGGVVDKYERVHRQEQAE